MKKFLTFTSLLLFLLLPGLARGWLPGRVVADVAAIKTAKPEFGRIRAKFLATGIVRPKVGAEVKVGSRVSGLVEKLYVKVGDRVKRGDLIAQIENRDLQARVQQAEAALQARQAELEKILRVVPLQIAQQEQALRAAKARFALASLRVERLQPLQQDDFVPKDELDNAQRNYRVYQAELQAARKQLRYLQEKFAVDKKVARQRVREAEATLTLAQINLGYATITAPIAGVVSLVSTQEGETVAASFNAPTFVNIIDLQRLQVVAYVDEGDIGRVKLGQEVVFTVDAYPEQRFAGRVREIYPKAVVRNNVVSYEVMVEIAASAKSAATVRLRPEMSAYVTFIVATKEKALLLPAAAVKLVHGRDTVYVRLGDDYRPRQVTLGLADDGKVEVVAGLKGDEEVVVAGFAALTVGK